MASDAAKTGSESACHAWKAGGSAGSFYALAARVILFKNFVLCNKQYNIPTVFCVGTSLTQALAKW